MRASAEESFLSALVSGRHAITRQPGDDAIFIDRDGPLFRHVLNYLRRGRLIVAPDDTVLHEELLDEAKFYQVRIHKIAAAMRTDVRHRFRRCCFCFSPVSGARCGSGGADSHVAEKHSFVFTDAMADDPRGLLYWLGTNGETCAWANPVSTGAIAPASSRPYKSLVVLNFSSPRRSGARALVKGAQWLRGRHHGAQCVCGRHLH